KRLPSSVSPVGSELAQNIFSAGDFRLARVLFLVEALYDAIIHKHGITQRARAHAEARAVKIEAKSLGEIAIAVAQHGDLAIRTLLLAPRTHHESIVDGEANDFIHALGANIIGTLHEAGKVLVGAGRRERAGQRKDHDLAALEKIARLHRCRTLIRQLHQVRFGYLVSVIDGHGNLLLF